MPNYKNDNYRPPLFLFNRHLETIYPALFRKVLIPKPKRERIITDDNDFIDLDWSLIGSDKLVIINHGLEGNSSRPYMQGMAKIFNQGGWDALAWNFRGCSEEMNLSSRFYHSGETKDMHRIIEHAAKKYDKIILTGFSLGGNIILKYLGENPDKLNPKVRSAAVFSVPVQLESSCYELMKAKNLIYERRFLNSLKNKIILKSEKFPGLFDLEKIMRIRKIMDFDNIVTAPLHGFKDAEDYYRQSSSLQFLNKITIPTLLVNSENDPFLSGDCFPYHEANTNPDFHFESWTYGGHVGYYQYGGFYGSEQRALQFIESTGI